MSITIFTRESGSTEESLVVNDDGTIIYEKENAGWVMVRKGVDRRTTTMSADEAKTRWPSYASNIDAALEEARRNRGATK